MEENTHNVQVLKLFLLSAFSGIYSRYFHLSMRTFVAMMLQLMTLTMQVFQSVLLSVAFSGSCFYSSMGIFTAMLDIYSSAQVAATVSVPVWLRCVSAFCTSLGVIIAGGRLMPITGAQCTNIPMLTFSVSTPVLFVLGFNNNKSKSHKSAAMRKQLQALTASYTIAYPSGLTRLQSVHTQRLPSTSPLL